MFFLFYLIFYVFFLITRFMFYRERYLGNLLLKLLWCWWRSYLFGWLIRYCWFWHVWLWGMLKSMVSKGLQWVLWNSSTLQGRPLCWTLGPLRKLDLAKSKWFLESEGSCQGKWNLMMAKFFRLILWFLPLVITAMYHHGWRLVLLYTTHIYCHIFLYTFSCIGFLLTVMEVDWV